MNARILITATFALLLALPAAAAALEVEARLGLGGYHRLDAPTPFELRIANRAPAPFVGEAAVRPNDRPESRRRVVVPPDGELRVVFPLVLDEAVHTIAAMVRGSSGVPVFSENVSVNAQDRVRPDGALVVVLDRYGARPDRSFLAPLDRVVSGGPEAVPDHPDALVSASAVLVGDVDPGALSDAQLCALTRHAAAGGRLVFYPAGDGAALRSPLFRSFFPGTPAPPEPAGCALFDPAGLEPLASAPRPASADPARARMFVAPGLLVSRLAPEGAGVVAVTPDQLERPVGRGRVVRLAFNPLDRALTDPAFPKAFRRLLAGPERVTLAPLRKVGERAMLPDSVKRPEPGLIFLFLFVYILLVGPVNYLWLASRRRRDLLLVTIPGGAALAGLVVFLLVESVRESVALTRRFDVVYHAGPGQPVFATSTLSRFSSQGESLAARLPDAAAVAPLITQTYGRNDYAEMIEGAVALADEQGVSFGPVRVERYSGAIFHAAAFLPPPARSAEYAPFETRPAEAEAGAKRPAPGGGKFAEVPPSWRDGLAGREIYRGRARFPGPPPKEAWLLDGAVVRGLSVSATGPDGWREVKVGRPVTPTLSEPDWADEVARDLVGTGLQTLARETGPLLVWVDRGDGMPAEIAGGGERETVAFHVADCPLAPLPAATPPADEPAPGGDGGDDE